MEQEIKDQLLAVPSFLRKLWKMVNNPSTDSIITWNSDETSFVIKNQQKFEYELLPMHYKHNNMSSFIRQLNLYGFHKIPNNDNKESKNMIQFYHPYFQKDNPELLKMIFRKEAVPKVPNNNKLSKLLTEVQQVHGRQQHIDSELVAIKKENAILWRQLLILRQKHAKQQQIVNKLIQFLVSVIQTQSQDTTNLRAGMKRHLKFPSRLVKKPNLATQLQDQNDITKKDDEFDYFDEDDDDDDELPLPYNRLTFGEPSSSDPDRARITEIDPPEYIVVSPKSEFDIDELIKTKHDELISPNSEDVLIGGGDSTETDGKEVKIQSTGDLDELLNNTDNDLDQFEDILKNCDDLNSDTLVGLFKDILPELEDGS